MGIAENSAGWVHPKPFNLKKSLKNRYQIVFLLCTPDADTGRVIGVISIIGQSLWPLQGMCEGTRAELEIGFVSPKEKTGETKER